MSPFRTQSDFLAYANLNRQTRVEPSSQDLARAGAGAIASSAGEAALVVPGASDIAGSCDSGGRRGPVA